MNGLPLANKFKNSPQTCYLCNEKNETITHLFVECTLVKKIYQQIIHNKSLNENNIIFHEKLNFDEINIVSNIKLCIWRTRNFCKYNKNYMNKIEYFFRHYNKAYT